MRLSVAPRQALPGKPEKAIAVVSSVLTFVSGQSAVACGLQALQPIVNFILEFGQPFGVFNLAFGGDRRVA